MSSVRNRNTGPELLLRRELHRRGLRYRVRSSLIGKPDIVFPRTKVVVFLDGDWWHGNTWRLRGFDSLDEYCNTIANGDFWRAKIKRNMSRDREITTALIAGGWQVLRLWESDVNRDVAAAADTVEQLVRAPVVRDPKEYR